MRLEIPLAFGSKGLHRKFAECTEDEKSVFDEEIIERDVAHWHSGLRLEDLVVLHRLFCRLSRKIKYVRFI